MAWGYARTSRVETPTSAAPFPRAMPCPAAIATRRPVNDPGPTATATRSTDESGVRVIRSARSIAGKSSSPCRRCACHVSSARTSRPSKSATDAQSVDVSSANNTGAQLLYELGGARPRGRDHDAPLRVGDVLELHLEAVVGQQRTRTVGPLDHGHPAGLKTFFPPGVREICTFEAVEVDVKEGQPSASVLPKDDERRARDVGLADAEPDGDTAREDRLPGPELARKGEDIVRPRGATETLAEPFSVQRRMAHEVERCDLAPSITHRPPRVGTCVVRGRAGG